MLPSERRTYDLPHKELSWFMRACTCVDLPFCDNLRDGRTRFSLITASFLITPHVLSSNVAVCEFQLGKIANFMNAMLAVQNSTPNGITTRPMLQTALVTLMFSRQGHYLAQIPLFSPVWTAGIYSCNYEERAWVRGCTNRFPFRDTCLRPRMTFFATLTKG